MSAEQIVYDGLLADVDVKALIVDRVYPDIAAQDSIYPFVVYARTGTEPTWTIHSALVAQRVLMNVSCWAKSRQAADDLADSAVKALQAVEALHEGRSAIYDVDTESYGTQLDVVVWE